MEKLLDRIQVYWNKRAASYSEGLFADETIGRWRRALRDNLPKCRVRRVLDIGTGPGFFASVLSMEGYEVTAVDYSPGMLEQARENADNHGAVVRFMQMDAQDLDFPDNTFDAIVSRNLTWNLEDPAMAYAEWLRVLRPGGILLNFDSSWYEYLYNETMAEKYKEDRINTVNSGLVDGSISYSDSPVMEEISKELIFSRYHRPQADLTILEKLNPRAVDVDETAWKALWDPEEKVMYASTPMFMIKVIK